MKVAAQIGLQLLTLFAHQKINYITSSLNKSLSYCNLTKYILEKIVRTTIYYET